MFVEHNVKLKPEHHYPLSFRFRLTETEGIQCAILMLVSTMRKMIVHLVLCAEGVGESYPLHSQGSYAML